MAENNVIKLYSLDGGTQYLIGTESVDGLGNFIDGKLNPVKTELEGTINGVEGRVGTLEGDVNTINTTTIPGLESKLNGLESKHGTDTDTINGKISTLEGTTIPNLESSLKAYADGIKTEILGDDLEETFNTLKAVQDWADEHGDEYTGLVAGVQGIQSKLDTLELTHGTDVENINGSIGDIEETIDELTTDTIPGLESQIDTVDGKFENYYLKEKVNEIIDGLNAKITDLEGRIKDLEDANLVKAGN